MTQTHVSPPRERGWVALTLLLVLALTAGLYYFMIQWPVYFGPHSKFFMKCLSLPDGSAPSAVVSEMRGYVLVDSAHRTVTEELAASDVRPAAHPRAQEFGADSRLLFFPTHRDTADWCLCYFKADRLVQIEVLPD